MHNDRVLLLFFIVFHCTLPPLAKVLFKVSPPFFSQPYLWKSGRMTFTLPKWGLGSPPGLLKFQSSIARAKTPRIGVFFIWLESYQNVDVENGLARAIWTSTAQVMEKRKSKIKLAVWLPTTKSRESAQPWCVQVECDTPLKSFHQELRVFLRPHPNRRFEQRVIIPQSGRSLNRDTFGTLLWESRDKKPFGCRCCGEAQKILYGGRW
jgi:hypothetical protein